VLRDGGGDRGIAVQARASGPDVVVTEQDNGKDVTLDGDQRLIIKLSSQPGTGYGWSGLMTADSSLAFHDPARATAQNAGPDGSANAWRQIGAGICLPRGPFTEISAQMAPADLLPVRRSAI
jgi:hypothetical protein